MRLFHLFLFLFPAFYSCMEKPRADQDTTLPSDSTSRSIFICNEGNFNWGNATLGLYQTVKSVYTSDLFRKVNGRSLGDVLQSVCIYDGETYLIVNNSGKIEIIDPKNFGSKGTITGLRSPRYMIPLSPTKAYVTDLYEKAVWIVNPKTKTITGKIPFNGWSEELLEANGKVFVCGRTSNYVYVLNPSLNLVSDSIAIGYGAQHICRDFLGKLWVLTVGGNGFTAQLHRINANGSVELSLNLGAENCASRLMTDVNGKYLYWIQKDLHRMSVESNTLPAQPWVNSGAANFYALGYDPFRHFILASDAKDFVQASEVFEYDTTGALKGSFRAGINTSFFCAKTP